MIVTVCAILEEYQSFAEKFDPEIFVETFLTFRLLFESSW